MDMNTLLAKLKANGSDKDVCDLEQVFVEYKIVVSKLSPKDTGTCALNVLCVLCRNLDKIPSWRDSIDNKHLLILAIECVRGTRTMEKADRVKTLACMYHIHKHIVKQDTPIPPELVLKFSYMPFECNDSSLLTEYHKTYWSIIGDRLTYIERLKSNRLAITKLLPKLIEDVSTVIKMYEAVAFCSTLLVFLVKKLQFIFNDSVTELNEGFGKIFEVISKKNDSFKDIKEREAIDLYIKFSECFVVITENSSKANFKAFLLDEVIRNCISMLGHNSDIFHCLQSFFLNGFCCVFGKQNSGFLEAIFKNLITACETTEKLGYKAAMFATYPYLNQFLRIYIESKGSKTDKNGVETQKHCLKLMLLLMKKLRKANQLLKCENCPVKTGLHDALRLSFLAKTLLNTSIETKSEIKVIFPYYHCVIESQYTILYELRALGCSNFAKCFRKLQTDIHNTAISLNKSQYFEFSIKIFDVYLINEVKNYKNETDLKNISRGLYNKSICELDCKLHEQALKDAYLSLVLANSELTDKYMSLVMDIKAKMLKIEETKDDGDKCLDEGSQDYFQMLSILDVSKMWLENKQYGDLKPFFKQLKFSTLLKHEFSMYVKLWPSIVPIAGVWRSLNDMANEKHVDWLPVSENREDLLRILYGIILETPSVVRTIHSDYYKETITELVENLEEKSVKSFEEQNILATLLFLKAEYDLTEASEKYGWKCAENTVDPDMGQAIRTLPQEHHAIKSAVKAVEIWINIIRDIKESPYLHHSMRIAEMFVHQFLHMQSVVHGLQLASICCELAWKLDEKESYIRNASVIISYAERQTNFVDNIVQNAKKFVAELMTGKQNLELCLTFMCDLAIYYNKLELIGVAAKLLGYVQVQILEACETQPDLNLDLAIGRLMEAQYELFGDKQQEQTILSVVNNIQRHYIAVANNGTTFTSRRAKAAYLKHRAGTSGARACAAAFSLRLYRRARAAAAVSLPRAAAPAQAALYAHVTNVASVEDAQIKIDNRLKHILGLQPTNEIQPYSLATQSYIKQEAFTPKASNFETMLDCNTFKKTQVSPSLPCITVPSFKRPEFFDHNPKCLCYACETIICDTLACYTCGLEAAMYFRAKEFDTARNYYEGALKMFEDAEKRFKNKMAVFKSKNFDSNILDIASSVHRKMFREITVEFLMDASFFELSQKFYEKADDLLVRIHEVMSEMRTVPMYLKNDVHNLMITSAHLRRVIKPPELGLESDFDALKLTPDKEEPLAKTPESKFVPVAKTTAKIVKAEELPNVKRKVIKLNLDDNPDEVEEKPKKADKKPQFKLPVPVIVKPAIENVTPRPTRSRPNILLTEPSLDVENTPRVTEFFTPLSTPSNEQFFTPMSSLKTYSKKSHIVKNLEAEFCTPKSVKKEPKTVDKITTTKEGIKRLDSKEGTTNVGSTKKVDVEDTKKGVKKVETGSVKALRDKRSLKRATSPGKLVTEDVEKVEKSVTKTRRRQLPNNKT